MKTTERSPRLYLLRTGKRRGTASIRDACKRSLIAEDKSKHPDSLRYVIAWDSVSDHTTKRGLQFAGLL